MNIAEARPPYIEFKRVPVDDAKRSQELGYRVTKDVDMVFVMQPGSKDQVERVATEWLAMLKHRILNRSASAYPQEWVDGFHRKYEAWKAGHEAPLDGTSVREWPVLSPAQVENFVALRILTVEDVAGMTEDALNRAGMGARTLRDKARDWLKGRDLGQEALKENEALKQQLAELSARLAQLESAPAEAAAAPKKRGPKPKQAEAMQ